MKKNIIYELFNGITIATFGIIYREHFSNIETSLKFYIFSFFNFIFLYEILIFVVHYISHLFSKNWRYAHLHGYHHTWTSKSGLASFFEPFGHHLLYSILMPLIGLKSFSWLKSNETLFSHESNTFTNIVFIHYELFNNI